MINSKLRHFSSYGAMGSLISKHDWLSSSLGDPEYWPRNLLTMVGFMLENKFPMYMLWGKDRIQLYNDAYIPLLGDKHPAALGNIPSDTWAEFYQELKPLHDIVYSGRPHHQKNVPFTTSIEGVIQERFFSYDIIPIREEEGIVVGLFSTVIDVTEDPRTKEDFKLSEKSFRNYQELSPLPFFSLTEDWLFDYINPAFLNYSPLKKHEVIGKSFFDVYETEGTIFFQKYQLAMNGEVVEFEGMYEPFNTWYRVFAYPLNPGVGVMVQDITEYKILQNKLEAAVESRDRFLSIASHELNTPLTSLKLHTQMMERLKGQNISEEKLEKFFKQADKQLTRLSRLVDDMLDVSRIERGKLSFKFETRDIRQALEEAVEREISNYQGSAVTPPELTFVGENFNCRIDLHRFEQVVSNLLTNALKYGDGGAVYIKLCELNDKLVLTVKDHGKGVAEKDKEHLFEQYYRGGISTAEGLGLGLFITKQIVDAHGGKISLESVHGEGTTFRVELPKK